MKGEWGVGRGYDKPKPLSSSYLIGNDPDEKKNKRLN